MTTLEATANRLGYSYSKEQAMTGSKYYRINSIKFRVSDHTQPSHYQSRQYFDVYSENEIINIISNPLFAKTFNPTEIDGEFYNMIYVEERDGFDRVKLSKEEFDKIVELQEKQKEFYKKNGWEGEIF